MTTTEADLLAAVHCHPDDDAPRLAHADWLEANGDKERAEFIRLQIRAVRLGLQWHERYRAEQDAATLLRTHQVRWLGPTVPGLDWVWSRGYPEVLSVRDVAAFAAHGRDVLGRGPRVIRLTSPGDFAPAAFAACEALAQVRELRLEWSGLGDDFIGVLAASPHLGGLATLRLRYGAVTGAGLAHLAAAEGLAGLEELEVVGTTSVTVTQAAAFAGSRLLGSVRRLTFASIAFGGRAAGRLCAAGWRRLDSLRMEKAKLDGGSLAGLDAEALPALTRLALPGNRLGDAGAELVARAAPRGLRELDLSDNLIGQAGVAALAASGLAALERLDLHRNAIPDTGAALLAEASGLRGLTHLALSGNLIGDAGMMALGRSRVLSSLRDFQGKENPARPAVIDAVTRRFREGLPPLTDGPAAPAEAVAAAPAAVIGVAEEDGLVRAILADPRDVLARSAYADWLEEQGKPLHAELLRLPPGKGGRAGEILAEIAETLAGSTLSLESLGGLLSARVQLRSFVSRKFGDNAPAWLRGQHVTELHIKGSTRDWATVGAAPAMAHVRALSLRNLSMGDSGVVKFAEAAIAGPCALSLQGTYCASGGVTAVAGSAGLAGLCRLDVAGTRPGADGLRALAEGALGQGLQHLIAARTHTDNTGAGVVAQAAWPALVTLNLSGNKLGDAAARALAAAPGMPRLRNLDLSGNSITDAGVSALAGSALLGRLRWVRMANNALGAGGWQALARAVAAVPGCVLSVPRTGLSAARLAEFREMLGGRLVQE